MKLYFGSNSPYITYQFLHLTGRANIPKSQTETLRDPIAGCPGGQI